MVGNELLSRELVNNRLYVGSLTEWIPRIGHTQERLTAHHKWMPGVSSMSGDRLKEDELAAIPLVNERVDVVFSIILQVDQGEECVTVDVEGLHIYCSIRLKRLQFDKAVS